MSLIIKKLTGEIFDLPVDYSIESEKNNPLFSTKGSQTVSISFPSTPMNFKLSEYAYRPDKSEKPEKKTQVVIESGSTQQSGLMAINTASDKVLSANIGFDESEMYTHMGNTLLKDLKKIPLSFCPKENTLDKKVIKVLEHLTLVMKEEIQADYYLFPVILKREEIGDTEVVYEVLNDFVVNSTPPAPVQGEWGPLLALQERYITRYVDGEKVVFKVPRGYGISPFLKVWKLLEIIFDNYELTISRNPFRDHRQLKKLVVLNNTMDAIISGAINYKDMMPDITVKEFLESLYYKFGMQYFVDSNTRTISIRFLKDILSGNQDPIDYTCYKTASPTIGYTAHKQLRLTCNREIEGTEGKWKIYDEFMKAHDYRFKDFHGESEFNFDQYTSIYNAHSRKYQLTDILGNSNLYYPDFFDWDKKADLPYEEIEMKDLCLPFENYNQNYHLFYLVDYKHLYSDVRVSGEMISTEQKSAKLAFAFGWGKTYHKYIYQYEYFFASQDNRDIYGEFMYDETGNRYDLSLTIHREDGLFNRFWKEYDAFLRHSNYEATAKLKLPEAEILNFQMYKMILIDGQPYLCEQVKFKLNKPDEISECKLRTLRLYHPYDLENEQKIAMYTPQEYYWNAITVKSSKIEQELTEKGVPYTIEGYSPDNNSLRSLIVNPPTRQEFEDQEVLYRYYYEYTVVYEIYDQEDQSFKKYYVVVKAEVIYYPAQVDE